MAAFPSPLPGLLPGASHLTLDDAMDKPKMVFAGVDAGAKMCVELNEEAVVWAARITLQDHNAQRRVAS